MMKLSRILFLSFIALIILLTLYGIYVYRGTVNAWSETYRETGEIHREDIIPETGENLTSILLLIIDQEGLKGIEDMDDPGRADAVLLILLNKNSGKITALSIPRDLRVEVSPEKSEKLTNTYVYGPEVTIRIVEDLLKFPVDHYIAFNYKAFADLVDAMGGIEIEPDESIASRFESIEEGPQVLDGRLAQFYVRFRSDHEGDFGRMRRQQQVLDALIHQAVNPRSFIFVGRFFTIAKENMRHNIPIELILERELDVTSISGDNFDKITLEGHGAIIDGIWYMLPDLISLYNIQNKLRSELDSSKADTVR